MLRARVQPDIMEAFAYGIQCVLNQDWDGLVVAFIRRLAPPRLATRAPARLPAMTTTRHREPLPPRPSAAATLRHTPRFLPLSEAAR